MYRCKFCDKLFNHTSELEKHECTKFTLPFITPKPITPKPITPKPITPKSPLGLKPEVIWKNERRREIVGAIDRYLQAGSSIPIEWVEEYNKLTKEVSQ